MKNILKYTLLTVGLALFFVSCEKSQTIYPSQIPEEGVYISGSGIFMDSICLAGLMDVGKILTWEDEVVTRDSLYQKFMFVRSSGNFIVSQQVGDQTVPYGLSGSWTEEEAGVWSADIVENGTNFTVTEDGFYFFAIDFNTSKVFLFKVDSWYLIGDAVLTSNATINIAEGDVENATWTGSDIEIQKGELHFCFYPEETYPIFADTVMMVTYLGGAFPEPEFGGATFTAYLDESDTFSFSLNYNFINQFTSTNTMPPYDPRVNIYSLIGSAFHQQNDPNNAATAWDVDFDLIFDENSDTLNGIYNFRFIDENTGSDEMYFIGGQEFKIRLNHDWGGGEMGYAGLDFITGDATNLSNAGGQYGNFKVGGDAVYKVTFTFNTNTYKKTLDVTSVQK